LDWAKLGVSLLLILGSAELFTNGIEWVGVSFGLSEGVVGSVLAAVGTALPETLLPLVAVLLGRPSGDSIGIGAILGAPFMLTTLAMFIVGTTVLISARGGRRSHDLSAERRVMSQDLGYFLAMYSLALLAGLLHVEWFRWALAAGLVIGYAFYVRRHFRNPGEKRVEAEAAEEIRPLRMRRWVGRLRRTVASAADPPGWASIGQALVALGGMLAGARIFVDGVDGVAATFHIPQLALALLIAPLATELPEKFNSVIWIRRRKDTLALGNLTGAMVFQSAFPVTVGLLLTPWRLEGDALVAALVALGAGSVLWVTIRALGRLHAKLLLIQGLFYVGFVTYVIARL
jgi:cation:H+ antiporter